MINWDGYVFTEKQVDDWMANVREILELVKAGGGGGGSVTAAQLYALINDTATVTHAITGTAPNQMIEFTAIGASLPTYPTDLTKEYVLTYNHETSPGVFDGLLTWQEVL